MIKDDVDHVIRNDVDHVIRDDVDHVIRDACDRVESYNRRHPHLFVRES